METVVRKWGNSLGIRIPRDIARELSLQDGSCVHISDTGKEMVITPVTKNRLSEMVCKINEDNLHAEVQTGNSVGREIW
jgi:antitoxin MazE